MALNNGLYTAIPHQDGTFVFHSVPPGSYLLEVFDTQRIWPTVKIDVSAKQAGKLRALMTHNRLPLPLPLPIEPLVGAPSFFEKREGFKISSMLMNPMVIMMILTMFIMMAMPKMMQGLDEEQLKEMQEISGGMSSLLTGGPKAALEEQMHKKKAELKGKSESEKRRK